MYNVLIYINLMILLILFVIFYGGHNNIKKIEYDSDFFYYINKIEIYRNKFIKYSQTYNYDIITDISNDFIYLKQNYIPNINHIYLIKLKAKKIYDIKILCKNMNDLMIIFNFNDYKNIEILIEKQNDYNIFYDVSKNIFITNIYDILNSNNFEIQFGIIFISKPFWYY